MKENLLPRPANEADNKLLPAKEAVRKSRGPALADLRARSLHLRPRRPGVRFGYSLLRTAATGFACAAQLALQPAAGGTITGTVRAEGKAGVDSGGAAGGDYDSRKLKFVERVDYSAMHDFVVYVDGVTATNATPDTNVVQVTTLKVAQESAKFSPHILPVLAGTTVEWPNNDDIFHNVFSVSDVAQFDLGLYKGSPPEKKWTFDQPGKVDVFCSIHANMHCIVMVMPNPYFASTDNHGNYKISGVPPGTYKLKAWHERLPVDVHEIIVPTNGDVKVDFTLTIKNLPKI
jgi:plastocyanin